MISIFDLAFGLLSTLLTAHGQKLPAELVQAGQAAIDAWATHRADVVTQANLEAERG